MATAFILSACGTAATTTTTTFAQPTPIQLPNCYNGNNSAECQPRQVQSVYASAVNPVQMGDGNYYCFGGVPNQNGLIDIGKSVATFNQTPKTNSLLKVPQNADCQQFSQQFGN